MEYLFFVKSSLTPQVKIGALCACIGAQVDMPIDQSRHDGFTCDVVDQRAIRNCEVASAANVEDVSTTQQHNCILQWRTARSVDKSSADKGNIPSHSAIPNNSA